ncbi:MAG: dNTP triphosphohydrolase [Pirellulaceae bacterium]
MNVRQSVEQIVTLPVQLETLISDRERALLAPYAMHSEDSAGRRHAEPEHPYRGPFQRDRDRILHSSAYRRLSGKMQVFTGEMGDYHRTRLTHTQEVATVARTIARALRLNEDLVEALALMHDIGHPPYGHAGEDALNECAQGFGGFSHNGFALTIVEELEIRYNGFPGLNLTREVLAGQTSRIDKQQSGLHRLLEVQLVDAADSAAYDAHDTDDAIKLNLVTLEEMQELALIQRSTTAIRKAFTNLDAGLMRKATVHFLVNLQATDLITWNLNRLTELNFQSANEARKSEFQISPSPDLAEQKKELETFLYNRVYRHPRLVTVRQTAQARLKEMYHEYCARPELIPAHYQPRLQELGAERMAIEYLAGMTDRFCEDTYAMMFPTAHGISEN